MQKNHIRFPKRTICFISICSVLLSGMIFVLAELGGYGVNGPATAPNSLDYGLVGYWDMEEEGQIIKDKSGNDNDGTLGSDSSAGTDDPVFVPGHNSAGLNGRGLGFDGVNDYADLGNDSILTSNSSFSYSFWMKWSGANKGGYGGLVQYLNRGTQNYRILIEDSASKIIVQDAGGTRLTSASSFSQGVFYHITLTWDGSLPRLYVNGKSDATGSAADFASAMVNNIKIGVGADWVSTYYFNGVMDEVRIYNRVLSQDEIRLLYNQKKPVLHLKMDEGSGTNLYDDSFGNHNAKVYNKLNTAASATANTLADTDVAWTANQWASREVSIVYGTGIGQTRTISSNTNNTLTVSQNWDTIPDNTSRYVMTLDGSSVWTTRSGQPALNLANVGYAGFAQDWAPISGTSEFTLEAWVKTSSNARQVIMAQRDPAAVIGEYLLEINSSGKAYYWDFNGAYGHNFYSNKTVADNNWHHIAFTRSGNMGYLYIDGVLDKTSTGTAINIISELDFEIGGDFRDANGYFNGSMDDIRVYNYARTADEVRADYNDNSAARLGAGAINLDYGLVGYWDMEEGEGQTLYDKSGNGNDIILGSSVSGDSADPVFAPGHNSTGENGTSLKFDGINDYVGRPDSKSLDLTTALTMSMWVNSRFLAADVFSLAGKTCGPGAGDHHYKLSTNGPLLQLAVGDGACGTGNVDSLDQAGFFTGYENKWVFVTATFNAGAMKLYRNGVLITSKTSAITALKAVSNNFEIGRYPNYSGIYVNGSIDEVRVYNRALSEDEIRYLYNQKKPILHLKMDEGSGSYVKDESFNGNDGIIYGSWGVASSGGSNTLTATRNWTTNEWTGESIEIYEGTGIGQTRTIVSNTNNQVTVSSNWITVPDNTSRYRITSRREWISGKNGSALSFDAVDDYVKINDSESLKLTKNITMEAWVYPVGKSGTTSWNRIISKDGTATGYVLGVRDGDNDGNLDSIVYRLNGAVYVPTVIDYNRWYHLAVAYDGANVRVYKDGKEIYSVAYTSAVNSGTSDLNIGHLFNNTDYFKGTIDDVRIYNYARTADEVKVDYNNGAAAHLGKNNQDLNYGLVGYWDMEEGSGQTVKDKSGNGNHGTLGYNLSAENQDPVFGSGYDSAGNNGTGIVLDGVDDLVEVDVNGGFNLPSGLSIGGWIKPSVASSQLKTGGWNYYSRGYWTTTPYEFGHWGNSNPSLKMYNSAGSSYSLSAGQPLAGDVWYHLFATVDPGTGAMKFYVNGVLKNSNTSFSGSLPGITSLVIGGGSSGCNFPGTIDEFRIYNRALSEDEILQLYNQKKPVLHFKMEEGSGDYAYDDSFNNNDGTLGGGTAANMPAWTQGKFGGGLSFDGNNDYIGVAHSNSLDITGKFTLEGWIYPTELNLEDCIFSKGGSSSCGNYDLYLYNGKLALLSTSSCNWSYTGDNSSVLMGQWQHIAASYDGTNVNYYINGVLKDSKAWGGIGTVNAGALEIGKQQSTTEGDFGGKMDDLRIYNYARGASEIRADYNAGLAAHLR